MSVTPSERPKQRVRLDPDVRRQRILDAALTVFAEHGYDASMGDVADAAEITRPTLYHYFPTKADLFAVVVEHELTEALRFATPVLMTVEGDRVRLRALLDALLTFAQERPASVRLLLRTLDDDDPEVVHAFGSTRDSLLAAVTMLVPEEADLVGMSPDSARGRMLAEVLLGSFIAGMRWWRHEPDTPREDVLDVLTDVSWKGIGGIAASSRRRRKRSHGN